MASAAQKKLVKQFIDITGLKEDAATKLLKTNNNDIQSAVEYFLSHQKEFAKEVNSAGNQAKLQKIFEKYAEKENPNIIDAEGGLKHFFNDIKVDPDSVVSLVVAWKCNAKEMGRLTQAEFVTGFSNLGADTVDKCRERIAAQQEALKTVDTFREFYNWVFNYCKGGIESKKTIEKDAAIYLWRLCVDAQKYPLVTPFAAFMETDATKAVNKDLWQQTFEFVRDTKSDLSNYDEDGAWPGVIDSFVTLTRGPKPSAAGGGGVVVNKDAKKK